MFVCLVLKNLSATILNISIMYVGSLKLIIVFGSNIFTSDVGLFGHLIEYRSAQFIFFNAQQQLINRSDVYVLVFYSYFLAISRDKTQDSCLNHEKQ